MPSFWRGIRAALWDVLFILLLGLSLGASDNPSFFSRPAAVGSSPLDREISKAAAAHGLDPNLLAAVVQVESGGYPKAVSDAGAMGLGQLMPLLVEHCGLSDPFDPAQNLDCSAWFLAHLVNKYPSQALALAAYHAGEPMVDQCSCIPREIDKVYVQMVMAAYHPGLTAIRWPYAGIAPMPLNELHGDGDWAGRDYLTPCGTALYAPITGRVVATGRDNYTGPFGSYNTYVHFSDGTNDVMMMHGSYLVKAGQQVEAGDLIGVEASNGNSTHCHTHLAIRINGRLVDPETILR